MEDIEIQAEKRLKETKSKLKERRKQGYVPAISYGAGKENFLLWVKSKLITDIMKRTSLGGTVFKLKVENDSFPVIIKEIQKDVITNKFIHIDFQTISLKEKIEVKVPVKLTGEEVALKTTGGIIDFPLRELRIKCLPKDIPQAISIDISNFKIGQGYYVRDIAQDKFTVLDDPNAIIVHIIAKKVEEVTPTEAAVVSSGPQEPEVIAKGKKEEEGKETTEPKEKEKVVK